MRPQGGSLEVAEVFAKDFKRFFLRGLAVLLPTMITLMIIIYVFKFVDNYLGRYMNVAVKWLVVQFRSLILHDPLQWKGHEAAREIVEGWWKDYRLWWIGFFLAILAIYVIGRFVGSFIGRATWRTIERGFFRMPVIKRIYPYVKQVTDFLFSEKKVEFSRVVAVEYPRKGIWSLGLVTGAGMRALSSSACSSLLTVFVPSSPTPVTGYTITVRQEEVIDLPISIDEALRFTVSGGVIVPFGQELSRAEIDEARHQALPPTRRKESQE